MVLNDMLQMLSSVNFKRQSFQIELRKHNVVKTWVLVLFLPLTGYVTVRKLIIKLSGSLLPHQICAKNGLDDLKDSF